jgi:TolB-like protein/DNA-binding winged helix-turn-helix (wHTH) protein/Tfp pilus assembly protein PilF
MSAKLCPQKRGEAMKEDTPPQPLVRFGDYELDTRAGELRKGSGRIRLHRQPLRLLLLLLEHRGEPVSREQLRRALWPDHTFVDFEDALNHAVRRLREALGDSAEDPRFIETLPRLGYRFIAPVDAAASPSGPATVLPGLAQQAEKSRVRAPMRRWALGLGIAALVGIIGAIGYRFFRSGHEPPQRIESLAVLPLVNLSGDPQQDFFADGMTEELITNLGRVSSLRVISRTSVMHYKGTNKTLPEIARELNVDAIVEGTVERSGDRVRITANLLQAPTDRHLWAQTYERDMRDVLSLQGDVACAIANEVRAKVMPDVQARLVSARPVNPEAYEAYLRGRHFWALNFGESSKALEYFEKATRLDPTFAPAYGGVALYYTVAGFSQPSKEVFPKAVEAANKALQLDPELAEAHAALGYAKLNYEWDWAGAESEFRKACELNPGSSDAHWMYAVYLTAMTRFDEAVSEANRARQVDPFSPMMNHFLGWVFMNARRYDEAIAQFKSTLELVPGYTPAHSWLAQCYTLKGTYREAYKEFNAAGTPLGDPDLNYVDVLTGKKKAPQALEALKRTVEHGYVDPYYMAILYCRLGDKEAAFAYLEKAFAERSASMPQMKMEPWFDPLRSDRRFQDLLCRMNLPP